MSRTAPDPNYRVKAWNGTDDDSSTELTNTVTVTGDTTVTVVFERIPEYELTVTVVGGHGTYMVDPFQASYQEDSIVALTAIPDVNYYVDGWYEGGDLLSVLRNFDLVMDSNKTVTLRFGLPEIIYVSGGGNALLDAVDSSRSGDTLVVEPATYNAGINLGGRRDVRLISTNPDDPDIVAKTIIDSNSGGRAFTFDNGEDANTVISGLSIVNGRLSGESGGAIYIGPDASPTLANLVISNGGVTNADGGAIYIGSGSSSTINNVTINNCTVFPGNGGAIYVSADSSPMFNCIRRLYVYRQLCRL
ncbi:MAG: InlB B-repeat-containing protein [Planctomycetota bacterium]